MNTKLASLWLCATWMIAGGFGLPAWAQLPRPILMGMGDSLGEGVQSGDASEFTQPNGYLNVIATHLSAYLPLPCISTTALGQQQDLTGRTRISPFDVGGNVSVSGATLGDLLRTRADARSVAEMDTELDLVMFPRTGSQMEVIEAARPLVAVCFIATTTRSARPRPLINSTLPSSPGWRISRRTTTNL
jgi:hypothetical protein